MHRCRGVSIFNNKCYGKYIKYFNIAAGIRTPSVVSEEFGFTASYSRRMSEHVYPADRAECLSVELINGASLKKNLIYVNIITLAYKNTFPA